MKKLSMKKLSMKKLSMKQYASHNRVKTCSFRKFHHDDISAGQKSNHQRQPPFRDQEPINSITRPLISIHSPTPNTSCALHRHPSLVPLHSPTPGTCTPDLMHQGPPSRGSGMVFSVRLCVRRGSTRCDAAGGARRCIGGSGGCTWREPGGVNSLL